MKDSPTVTLTRRQNGLEVMVVGEAEAAIEAYCFTIEQLEARGIDVSQGYVRSQPARRKR